MSRTGPALSAKTIAQKPVGNLIDSSQPPLAEVADFLFPLQARAAIASTSPDSSSLGLLLRVIADRDRAGIWDREELVRLDTGQRGIEQDDLQGPALAREIATHTSKEKHLLFVVRSVSEVVPYLIVQIVHGLMMSRGRDLERKSGHQIHLEC
jgi:hypothetical protein